MGKVKKFGPSSTVILRRNRCPKKSAGTMCPPAPLGLNESSVSRRAHPPLKFTFNPNPVNRLHIRGKILTSQLG